MKGHTLAPKPFWSYKHISFVLALFALAAVLGAIAFLGLIYSPLVWLIFVPFQLAAEMNFKTERLLSLNGALKDRKLPSPVRRKLRIFRFLNILTSVMIAAALIFSGIATVVGHMSPAIMQMPIFQYTTAAIPHLFVYTGVIFTFMTAWSLYDKWKVTNAQVRLRKVALRRTPGGADNNLKDPKETRWSSPNWRKARGVYKLLMTAGIPVAVGLYFLGGFHALPFGLMLVLFPTALFMAKIVRANAQSRVVDRYMPQLNVKSDAPAVARHVLGSDAERAFGPQSSRGGSGPLKAGTRQERARGEVQGANPDSDAAPLHPSAI